MIKCPEKCLVCGADWNGGSVKPGEPMGEGKRVFYECGASMSVTDGYGVIIKGCKNDES